MDRIVPEPRTFKDMVEADLRRAARIIIDIQDEIDPQFRIATREGDYWIALTFPADAHERGRMLRRLATFMAWKQAPSFIMASELTEPDCVCAIGVSAKEAVMCTAMIAREPRPWSKQNFGAVEWWPRSRIGSEMIDLLPRPPRPMTPKEISALEKWFGVSGRFPAVHIASREVRGL